jgi:hypothetical protein
LEELLNEELNIIETLRPDIEASADVWGVKADIHPQDFIFHFLIDNSVFESKQAAVKYYFDDGANSAEKLRELLERHCDIGEQPFKMLEFASGYGCVSRHILQKIPTCELTACDIHAEAIQFLEQTLGIDAIPSTSQPEDLPTHNQYDVVFALSFFSHMPKVTFGRWLSKLIELIEDGGFLLFTTHGLATAPHMPDTKFDAEGYYFVSSSEQKDLDTAEYGTSVIKPAYVFSKIFEIEGSEILYFKEAAWWGHQDLYILRKGSLQ